MQINFSADAAMLSASRRSSRRTAWMPLLSALLELAESRAERSWASVTFSGARHTVVLSFAGAEAVAVGERFIDALPEHEFAIPRHLVADAAVIRVDHSLLPEPRLEVEVQLLLLDEA